MSKFIIEGANELRGEVAIMGSKNAATKLLAASLLFDTPVVFSNVPAITDVKKTILLLEKLGSKIELKENSAEIDTDKTFDFSLDPEIAKNMRSSVVFLGPLLARFGKAEMPHPGGCVIGKRPIDFFIDGLQKLGASFSESDGVYKFSAVKLTGAEIFLPFPSVTATETLMMAAITADGRTVIKNAASEPEIPALADFLKIGGADIEGAGTTTIIINGQNGKLLKSAGIIFAIPPDRIETGSFLILGALAGNPLRITSCQPEHVESLILKLENAGVNIKRGRDWLEVGRPEKLYSVPITTAVYPGFATDLQPPFAIFLTQASGSSLVFETVWEGRLGYLEDIKRMGANVVLCDPHRAIIAGPTPLRGRVMESPDLRAGLAFVIAALIAEGLSEIHNIFHIDRGYSEIEKRLQKIGAKIARV